MWTKYWCVGDDECVGLAVDVLFDMGDVEIDILVVEQGGLKAAGGSVEGAVNHYLQARAAVVGTRHVEAAGDEAVFVLRTFQDADLLVEEALHAAGTQVGQLGVGGDAVLLVDGYADILVVEHGGHIAQVAELPFVVDVLYLGGIGGGGDGYRGRAPGGEDVAQLAFNHGLGEVAYRTARVGGGPQVGSRRVVVLSSLKVMAVVRDVVDEVDFGRTLLGGVLNNLCSDADKGFVV